ncbi:unnamed protein product [Ceutorhynchus assimilis]|uniref:Sodium channel protein Nach n=1 Tax=Ceutorhynchus assimilis TaxID=467358 RepID=A0A9N9MR35_9CUCU|nr:unnamed protein product [Ceutorhynchus assimilis]
MNNTALNELIETKGSKNKTQLRAFLITLFNSNYTNFENVIDSDELTSDEYMPTIIKLQNKIKPDITFSSQSLSSAEWLHETITEMGLCYSFNSQLALYNSPQNIFRYWINATRNLLPERKIFELHPLDGETFVNIVNIPLDHHVFIHGPYEVADIRSKSLFIGRFSYVQLFLKPLSIITSENAKQLMVTQRKCRFYYENNLEHFPVYTYVLCRMECRIRLTMKLCGCIPHFYKRLPGEKTCNGKGLRCLAQFKEQLISLEGLESDCKCPVNCEEVNYVAEDVDEHEFLWESNLQYGIRHFPEMRLRRDVIFGFSDLLVYIGGVMGLFLGSSVLTVIELLYYFTLRLFWIVVRNKKMS